MRVNPQEGWLVLRKENEGVQSKIKTVRAATDDGIMDVFEITGVSKTSEFKIGQRIIVQEHSATPVKIGSNGFFVAEEVQVIATLENEEKEA